MDEFSALAHRVAGGVADVRGCLILSREGMIVGSFPDDETVAKHAWVRFAAMGEPERGFLQFPDQTWVYVHRGPYAAFAVATASVRPGLLMDRLEQALLMAEATRTRRETLLLPEPAPSGKPRAPLHPTPDRTSAERSAGPARTDDEAREGKKKRKGDERSGTGASPDPEPPAERPPALRDIEEASAARQTSFEIDDEAEVDRVLLAKEFSGLLQVDGGDDEGRSRRPRPRSVP